jgi:micrococcal nuclease
MIGIDTLEIEDDPADTQLEALLAKRFTFHHLFRRQVKLSYDRDIEDKYGRLLAYVWTDVGLFNEFILKEGFARVYLKFPYGMEEKFIRAQKQAQEEGRGFWYQGPYPLIAARQAGDHIGELSRVRFSCARVRRSGNLLFLLAQSGGFAVLIPEEHVHLFSDIQSMEGKIIQVFGFLEEYRGQPQIMVFYPSQIIGGQVPNY